MFFIHYTYNIKCTQYIIYENEIGLLVLSHLCSGALQIIYIQHVNDMLQVCCFI